MIAAKLHNKTDRARKMQRKNNKKSFFALSAGCFTAVPCWCTFLCIPTFTYGSFFSRFALVEFFVHIMYILTMWYNLLNCLLPVNKHCTLRLWINGLSDFCANYRLGLGVSVCVRYHVVLFRFRCNASRSSFGEMDGRGVPLSFQFFASFPKDFLLCHFLLLPLLLLLQNENQT